MANWIFEERSSNRQMIETIWIVMGWNMDARWVEEGVENWIFKEDQLMIRINCMNSLSKIFKWLSPNPYELWLRVFKVLGRPCFVDTNKNENIKTEEGEATCRKKNENSNQIVEYKVNYSIWIVITVSCPLNCLHSVWIVRGTFSFLLCIRKVKKCGVKLLYAKDNDLIRDARVDRDQRLNAMNCSVDGCLSCCLGFCPRHRKIDDYKRLSETFDRCSPHSELYKQQVATP